MVAITMVHRGQRGRGLEWAQCALAADPEEPLVLYNVACVYALLGQADEAIDCIDRAIAFGAWREWMENDPDLSSLHGDPRFHALLDRL